MLPNLTKGKKILLLLLLLVLLRFEGQASHIAGGEIYYDCLGGNVYTVTMKIYRNCYDGEMALDDPAYVFIFDASGNFIDSLAIQLNSSSYLPPVISNPCFTPPANVCIEEGIYQRNIFLPPLAGGYDLSYLRCCRSNSLSNMLNPGFTGSSYMIHIPGPELAVCNSSPHFTHFPPIFLCSGVPVEFDHSAMDPDGDSLYYDFCDPTDGGTPACPGYGPQGFLSPCSEIPPAPPYPTIPWAGIYNASYPMAAAPSMAINHSTGALSGTPTALGQWEVSVCASEFRNGQLLSTVKRDFIFVVVLCQGLPVASFPAQTDSCFGMQVHFTQNSMNASTCYWDFGDPATTEDHSTAASPVWTYSAPGNYPVTLTINKDTPCEDTATIMFSVRPLLDPVFTAPPGECFFNNRFDLIAGGAFQGSGTFQWNLGAHASPAAANTQNVNNVSYDTTGAFPVSLVISENGCTDSASGTIHVFAKPVAHYGLSAPVACTGQYVHFIDSSSADSPLSYAWAFGDGSTSAAADPYHIYPSGGSYMTSVTIISSHGCADTFALPAAVTVFPTPSAGFSVTPTDTSIFYPWVILNDHSSGGSSCAVYWGDGTMDSTCIDSLHTFTSPAAYQVMQVVGNTNGCYDTAYANVIIRPEFMFWLPNAFTPESSSGLNDTFGPKLIGVHEYSFLIFDRWGNKIYETTDPSANWDGSCNRKICSNDVYVYTIAFRDDVRNDPHQFVGHVTLIR